MRREFKRTLSAALGAVLVASMVIGTPSLSLSAANDKTGKKYQTRIEFEDANRYEQNGRNRIDSSMFSGYSGSGYVYLEQGWGEVNFTVPKDGDYKIIRLQLPQMQTSTKKTGCNFLKFFCGYIIK